MERLLKGYKLSVRRRIRFEVVMNNMVAMVDNTFMDVLINMMLESFQNVYISSCCIL